jgi:phage terminase small subunit
MAQREEAEASLKLDKKLSVKPPAELEGYLIAQSCWKYLIRLYSKLEGIIITPFDKDILIEYCLGMEYVNELRTLRRVALKNKNYELYMGIDTRLDRKGARLDTLRAQLYLTPRSRAGVAPVEKEKEEEDPMEKLLNEAYGWKKVLMSAQEVGNG